MKILVLFSLNERTSRSTINEHLYSFKKYGKEHSFHYVNVLSKVPSFLAQIKYDAIIMHYTFLGEKRFLDERDSWDLKIKGLSKLQGYKIAIPQDEYDCSERLCELFKKANVDIIYTCFTTEEDILKAYPFDKTGVKKIEKVFTGYIDEEKIESLNDKSLLYNQRPIDIGYRGRKLPANFGRHGQLKYVLVNVFNSALLKSGLISDIKNTNEDFLVEDPQAIKLGFAWYDFLLDCKAFIGCEGGSSLLDTDGSIKKKVNQFVSLNPGASFDEIEAKCFEGQDYNITCFALSPRHFEAAMTKTLQILVEGEYGGVFKPWVHYIPLNKDFSNMENILTFLKDVEGCQKIILNSYNDIVLSGNYTYRSFVSRVIGDVPDPGSHNQKIYSETAFLAVKGLINARNVVHLYGSLIRKKIKSLVKN